MISGSFSRNVFKSINSPVSLATPLSAGYTNILIRHNAPTCALFMHAMIQAGKAYPSRVPVEVEVPNFYTGKRVFLLRTGPIILIMDISQDTAVN